MAASSLALRNWSAADVRGASQEIAKRKAPARNLAGRFFLAIEVARERRALGGMTPEQLKDLGVSPSEAQAEAARPFWDLPSNR